jgi:hypothetical protein
VNTRREKKKRRRMLDNWIKEEPGTWKKAWNHASSDYAAESLSG